MQPLDEIVDRLAALYGEPVPPPARTLLDLVLLENVAYLVDDERRLRAFDDTCAFYSLTRLPA
jgi:hypothetical protein